LNPAARALVTGAVTDKALSVLLNDTANLRVLGEVGARVMAVVREGEECAAKWFAESEARATERTAALIRESEERLLKLLAHSDERMLKQLADSEARDVRRQADSEARSAALLEVALGGPFAACSAPTC
jgi:hypothetical protein